LTKNWWNTHCITGWIWTSKRGSY